MAKQEIQPKPAEAASERAVEKRSFHRSALVLGIFTLLFALVGRKRLWQKWWSRWLSSTCRPMNRGIIWLKWK